MYFKLTFFFIFLGIVTTIGQSTIGKVNNSQFDDKMAADVAGKNGNDDMDKSHGERFDAIEPDFAVMDDTELEDLSGFSRNLLNQNTVLPTIDSLTYPKYNSLQVDEINRILLEKIKVLSLQITNLDKENKILMERIEALTK